MQKKYNSNDLKINVVKIKMVKESTMKYEFENEKVCTSSDVVHILTKYLDLEDRENFVVLMLSNKNKILGINTVSIGSLTMTVAEPREVFKAAILANAAAIIIAHNHPSGNSEPSKEDDVSTKRMVEAGKLLGIPVLDHIIIGEGGYFSYNKTGNL